MKKILTAIIAALMIASMAVGAAASTVSIENIENLYCDDNYTFGDVNGDGAINAQDALAMKAAVVGVDGLEASVDAADFDLSGDINSADVFYMKKCLAGAADFSSFDTDRQLEQFTIAGNPADDYEIVLNDDFVLKADSATYAAKVIKSFLYKATNGEVELDDVIGEAARTKPHMIRIVRMDPQAEPEERMNLGYEDYIYEVKNGDLYIYGTLRGCMYAAYEIAEKYWGFRYYSPNEAYIYEQRAVDMPEGTRVYHESRTEFRYSGQRDNRGSSAYFYYYLANRLNGTQRWNGGDKSVGYFTGPMFDNAHSFHSCWKMGDGYYKMIRDGFTDDQIRSDLWGCWAYGAYGGDVSWQPCASSFDMVEIPEDPAELDVSSLSAWQKMIKGMFLCQELKAYEDADFRITLGVNKVSFSHCDNTNGCQCRTCKAKYNGGPLKRINADQAALILEDYTGEATYDPKTKEITFKKEGFTGAYLNLTNKAAKWFREVYPDAEIWTIIYSMIIPETVRPIDNISIMYCGHGCMQHQLGTHGCSESGTVLGGNNLRDEEVMGWWADTVHAEGGHIWFWSYAVSYNYYFAPCPDVLDFWNNYNFILNTCHFDGVYYEGCDAHYNFEVLKAYLSNNLSWNPDMTSNECTDMIKEWLAMYYGDGWEDIYTYLEMQQAAGDATGECFITNHDRPWDFYSWQYWSAHYEEMRALLESAYAKANDAERRERIQWLIYSCDFMGISSAYDRYNLNADEEHRTLYVDRITAIYNWTRDIYENTDDSEHAIGYYTFPEELDLTICPMNLFYGMGAWRTTLIPSFAK